VPLDVVWVVRLELLQEVGDLLLGLNQDLAEVLADVLVAVVVEGGGLASVADTSGATDAVDVLGDAVMLSRRQVVVDDMLDVGDIEAASGDTSSDENGAAASTEGAPVRVRGLCHQELEENLQGVLALALGAVGVDRGDGQTLVVQEVINHVALDLGVGEDQDTLRLIREDEIDESLVLGALLDEDDLLCDVRVGAADTADL
jgi:hypothetical protein